MIYNLPESVDKNSDIREQHHLDLVRKLFAIFLPDADCYALKAFRVGKRCFGKIMPLKIVLQSKSDVMIFFPYFSPESAASIDPLLINVRASRDRTIREIEYF